MGDLREPWRTAAEQAGVRQSLRGIAERADLSHATVRRLINEGRTSAATVAAVSAALGVDEGTVLRWAEVEVSDLGPWVPPMESHKLGPRARAALAELILAITQEVESDAGAEPGKKSASVTQLRPQQQRLAARRGRQTINPELDRQALAGEEDQDSEG